MKNTNMYNNATMLKALEDVDKEKAIEAISNPNLDGRELSELLECSLLGKIVNKDSKEPMKFSNELMMAGIRNRLNQIGKIFDNLLTLNQILEEFGVSKITIEVAKNLGMSELSTFDELHLIAVDYLVDTQSKDVYQPSI